MPDLPTPSCAMSAPMCANLASCAVTVTPHNGQTWPPPVRVTAGGEFGIMPCLSRAKDGRVVLWHRRIAREPSQRVKRAAQRKRPEHSALSSHGLTSDLFLTC